MSEVKEACIDVFAARGAHEWPPELLVPELWAEPYAALAEEMDFPVTDVEDAATQVRELIAAVNAA